MGGYRYLVLTPLLVSGLVVFLCYYLLSVMELVKKLLESAVYRNWLRRLLERFLYDVFDRGD